MSGQNTGENSFVSSDSSVPSGLRIINGVFVHGGTCMSTAWPSTTTPTAPHSPTTKPISPIPPRTSTTMRLFGGNNPADRDRLCAGNAEEHAATREHHNLATLETPWKVTGEIDKALPFHCLGHTHEEYRGQIRLEQAPTPDPKILTLDLKMEQQENNVQRAAPSTAQSGIDAKDSWGRTPLSLAAAYGHEAVGQLLLERGADIDMKDSWVRTPLSRAAENGYEAVVQLLLARRADVDAKDSWGWTPLSWAAGGHEGVVPLLQTRPKGYARTFDGHQNKGRNMPEIFRAYNGSVYRDPAGVAGRRCIREHLLRRLGLIAQPLSLVIGGLATAIIVNVGPKAVSCSKSPDNHVLTTAFFPSVFGRPDPEIGGSSCPLLPFYILALFTYLTIGILHIMRRPKYLAESAIVVLLSSALLGAVYGFDCMLNTLIIGGYLSLVITIASEWFSFLHQ